MNPDYTSQLERIIAALDHHDWYTPFVGIVGVLIGWSMPFLLEIWKGKRADDLLLNAAYREAALQFGELIGLLHTFKINAPANLHVNFGAFTASTEHYSKAAHEPRLFGDTSLAALKEVHRILHMVESLCAHKLAIGEEYAGYASNGVFEIEDMILKGSVDRKRFCKFLDERISKRLLVGKSTEEFWRITSAVA